MYSRKRFQLLKMLSLKGPAKVNLKSSADKISKPKQWCIGLPILKVLSRRVKRTPLSERVQERGWLLDSW